MPTSCRKSTRIFSTSREANWKPSTNSSEAINPSSLRGITVPAPPLLPVLTPLPNVTVPAPPPPSRPTPPSRPQSLPPYTHYRERPRQPSPAARPQTPPTPYRPISPQEPFQSDTLPDAPNRSPSPSVLGWDTYITDRQSARGSNTSHTHFPRRGNLANCGIRNGQGEQGLHHINSRQDASHQGNNRGGASRGRRQRPCPLHERIHF